MTKTTTPRDKILKYLEENPNRIYASGYDDVISDEMAQMLLTGRFDEFSESALELISDYVNSADFWYEWENEYARAFGDGTWDDIHPVEREFVEENRMCDETPWLEDAIKHWRGHIVASLMRPDAPEGDNLIYAPSNWTDSDGEMDDREVELARWLIDTFNPVLPEGEGTAEERLRDGLEIVYGGYDREKMVVGGKLNLFEIWQKQEKPGFLTVGPEDVDNILFYEHFNGCGNMGSLKLQKTVTLPAEFEVDSLRTYGVDSCYGFTGSWWNHELRVSDDPKLEAELDVPAM